MTIQEHTIQETRAAADEFFRYALAIPEDKIEWRPLDAGRHALELCREVAMCPTWTVDMLNTRSAPDWSEESESPTAHIQASWTTIEDCRRECEGRLEELYAVIAGLTDEQLKETIWLPFEGGRDYTLVEVMTYPRWNMNYHVGQIGYIQTLYGDKEMY